MRFENDERLPWEKEEVSFQENKVQLNETAKMGWCFSEKIVNESESTIAKNTVQSTLHFKNNLIPKSGGTTGVALQIKDEVVKYVKKHVEDVAKQKEEELKKKDENHGSPVLLALAGIVFAFIFIFVTPIIIIFDEATSHESPIIEVAKTELSFSEDNIGGVKYKEWYGINGNWCAMFVSYCANECEFLEKDIMPRSASVMNMSNWYKERNQWEDAEGYIPKAGDIIFFQNGMSHVGIVIGYDSINKIITTIEGNTGEADTTLEHGHDWHISICRICGGDHIFSEEQNCTICNGTGYLLTKSGISNVYDDCSTIMKYTGCGSCGGSGSLTDYYNKYGLAWSEGSMTKGAGKTGENIFCTNCYGNGPYMGEVVRCNTPGCVMSFYGAWDDYPDGVCFTTECEYHEASRVKQRQYPLTYAKISGYGLPDYYKNWFEELFSGE